MLEHYVHQTTPLTAEIHPEATFILRRVKVLQLGMKVDADRII